MTGWIGAPERLEGPRFELGVNGRDPIADRHGHPVALGLEGHLDRTLAVGQCVGEEVV